MHLFTLKICTHGGASWADKKHFEGCSCFPWELYLPTEFQIKHVFTRLYVIRSFTGISGWETEREREKEKDVFPAPKAQMWTDKKWIKKIFHLHAILRDGQKSWIATRVELRFLSNGNTPSLYWKIHVPIKRRVCNWRAIQYVSRLIPFIPLVRYLDILREESQRSELPVFLWQVLIKSLILSL